MKQLNFKFKAEEFQVEEIQQGMVLEAKPWGSETQVLPDTEQNKNGKFIWFVLQKKNWTTTQALEDVAKMLYIKPSRLNFAGTKDRNAVTVQLCSAFAVQLSHFRSTRGRDWQINSAWREMDKVRMGQLQGNRFTIMLTKENCGKKPNAKRLLKNFEKSHGSAPNFFGMQRFGSMRRNTAEVGKLMLQGKFDNAVWNYLTYSKGEENKDFAKARKKLEKQKDFQKALDYYTHSLKFERKMLFHLSNYPNDFIGALRTLPRNLQLMFVHALQSKLFNEMLERKLKEGKTKEMNIGKKGKEEKNNKIKNNMKDAEELLPGYESKLDAEWKRLLNKEGVEIKMFKMPRMPELASKGEKRKAVVEVRDFRIIESDKDKVKLGFSLESGAYATTIISFLMR